jgi:heme oxygenase
LTGYNIGIAAAAILANNGEAFLCELRGAIHRNEMNLSYNNYFWYNQLIQTVVELKFS